MSLPALPRERSREQLEQLAIAYAATPRRDEVLELIIEHPACDAALLERLLELSDSASLHNAIVTSGKASRTLLERLQTSPWVSVREHVEFALVCLELDEGDAARFAEILQRYREHESLGYGVRDRLAAHPGTPLAVLRELASFDDPPGHAARERLARLAP
jgi:hypothetical protein